MTVFQKSRTKEREDIDNAFKNATSAEETVSVKWRLRPRNAGVLNASAQLRAKGRRSSPAHIANTPSTASSLRQRQIGHSCLVVATATEITTLIVSFSFPKCVGPSKVIIHTANMKPLTGQSPGRLFLTAIRHSTIVWFTSFDSYRACACEVHTRNPRLVS